LGYVIDPPFAEEFLYLIRFLQFSHRDGKKFASHIEFGVRRRKQNHDPKNPFHRKSQTDQDLA